MDNGLKYSDNIQTDFSDRYEGRSYYEGTIKADNNIYHDPQAGGDTKRFQRPEAGQYSSQPERTAGQYERPQTVNPAGQYSSQPERTAGQYERPQTVNPAGQYSSQPAETAGQYDNPQTVTPVGHYSSHPVGTAGHFVEQVTDGARPKEQEIYSSPRVERLGSRLQYTPASVTAKTDKEEEAEPVKKEPVKKKKKGFLNAFKMTAAAIILGGFAGSAFYGVNHYLEKNNDDKDKKAAVETVVRSDSVSSQGITDLGGTSGTMNYDVAKIAEEVQPSIVSITTTVTTTYQYYFQQFEQESTGAGSGIIIGKDSDHLYIATNYHVVEGASEINVGFVDGEILKARIKGYDANADIAVVTVDFSEMKDSTANAIKIASVGDSDSLVVGEPVIAIGNALGYGQSVTVGYISALDRQIEGGYGTYIQTDAAINPGNSGGALINSAGQVIGVNSVKYVDSKVEGMGFSIPSNRAMSIIENIIEGKNGKTYLGITGADISKEYAQIYGFPEGIYVKSVESSSPASEAGIHTGDIIVEFDGKSVYTIDELLTRIEEHNDGDKVSITLYRTDDRGNYKKVELEAELGFSVTSH